MFKEMGDYFFDSFEEFNNAYEILVEQGESLYSPGYFHRYGISRQLLYTWATRDLKIRRLLFTTDESPHDKFIFIVESDVMRAFNNSSLNNNKK